MIQKPLMPVELPRIFADDVAVDLLQDDDEDDVDQALHRRDEQNDQRRRHRADERPNTGMIFVTATITLTSTTYGMRMIAQQI